MNPLKYIFLFLLMMNGALIKAHWPADGFLLRDKYMSGVILANNHGIFVDKYSLTPNGVSGLSRLNKSYVTGINSDKTVKPTFRLLSWNGKMRVKLNRNMNLIFSYN